MRRPDFLCIGAQKAGTTWLHAMLGQHPDVFLPPIKEIHFFDYIHIPAHRGWVETAFAKDVARLRRTGWSAEYLDRLTRRRRVNDPWYSAVFMHPEARGKRLGEITPAYSILPEAGIAHVRRINPDMRLIFVIREPVDRALSHLRMIAARRGLDRVAADTIGAADLDGALARSTYAENIARWEAAFPEAQILYLPYPAIRRDPEALLRRIEGFLDLDPHAYDGLSEVVHKTRPAPVDAALARQIEARLAGERRFLQDRFGAEFLDGATVQAPARRAPRLDEVLIHAGIHRTGTTSLQTCLSGNRGALAAQGVDYAGDTVHHQHLVTALKRRHAGTAELFELLETAPRGPRALLSGEDFSSMKDLGWLKELAGRHPVRAIFYLRRQDHWMMSWYNQHLKWPFDPEKSRMAPEEFLARIGDFHWLDFEALVGRWEAVLGRDRVDVRIVEPGQVEDVIGDFLSWLGVDEGPIARPETRINDSLPVHLLGIVRHLGLYEMGPGKRQRVLAALRAALGDKMKPPATVFTPEQRHAILDRFEAPNRRLAQARFGRDTLFLEPRPAPDAPFFRFPEMSQQELLRDWIGPLVQELLKR